MSFSLRVTTPPSVEPVNLDEAKTALGVTGTDDDALISGLLQAARETVEGLLGRALITQQLRLAIPGFRDPTRPQPSPVIRLPRPPLQTVDSVAYVDGDGAIQTVAATLYDVDSDSEPAAVFPKPFQAWPVNLRIVRPIVTIDYTAGYGDKPEDVPEAIRRAIIALTKVRYATDPSVATERVGNISVTYRDPGTNPVADELLAPYRVLAW